MIQLMSENTKIKPRAYDKLLILVLTWSSVTASLVHEGFAWDTIFPTLGKVCVLLLYPFVKCLEYLVDKGKTYNYCMLWFYTHFLPILIYYQFLWPPLLE